MEISLYGKGRRETVRHNEDGPDNNSNSQVQTTSTAGFSAGNRQQTVRWLESAVLTREEGKWKIAVLHSTRLK